MERSHAGAGTIFTATVAWVALTLTPAPDARAAAAGQCPASGSCCQAHATPGCSNAACCNLICGADPFCCQVEWDELCAESACAQCASCDCFPDCTLACQPGDSAEGEACGASSNGGCSVTPPVFGSASDEQVICGTAWASGGLRDTDWYLTEAENLATAITAQLTSEFSGVCYVIDGLSGCEPVILGEAGSSAGCIMEDRARAVVPAGTYAVFVSTAAFDGVPCGTSNDYRVAVTVKCVGDTNESGAVNVVDLILVLFLFDTPGIAPSVDTDVNDDGTTNIEDLIIVIRDWGPCVQ